MAYGRKYEFTWSSPMRDKRKYYVFISEEGYEGDSVELTPIVDALTITQGKRDCDILEPILPTEVTIRLKVLDNPERYLDLYTDDPRRLQVTVAELTGTQSILRFVGYISTGVYSQPYSNPPYTVELKANDGFEILKNIAYEQSRNKRYTGVISLVDLFGRLLEPLSTGYAIRLWGLDPITQEQTGDTADLVGLVEMSIYSAFENETPTHYDLLTALLRNYGLQLWASHGYWNIRPVYALTRDARPDWYAGSFIKLGVLARPLTLPLSSDGEGRGMSTSAVLSMQPPTSTLSVDRTVADTIVPTSMLDPHRWVTHNYYSLSVNPYLRTKVGRGTEGVRIYQSSYYPVSGEPIRTGWAAYVFDGMLTPSAGATIKVTLPTYNLLKETSYIEVGFFAIGADYDPLDWLTPSLTESPGVVTAPAVAAGYMNGGWGDISGMRDSMSDLCLLQATELSAATRDIPFLQRISLRNEEVKDIKLTIVGIPSISDRLRLVMVVTSSVNSHLTVEITEPTIEIEYGSDIVLSEPSTKIVISDFGSENLSFEQRFPERGASPSIGGGFTNNTVKVSTEYAIAGYIAPTIRPTLPEITAARLQKIEGRATQTLEGEVYFPAPFDFNTTFADDQGKLYYATYIQEICRRGLHSVKLRELPVYSANVRNFAVAAEDAPTSRMMAFDTTAFYLNENRLLMLDIYAQRVVEIATFEGEVSISMGYDAVCVVEELTSVYNLYAYDSRGRVLSEVIDIYSIISPPTESSYNDILARNALYDNVAQAWTIIGNIDESTDKLQISVVDRAESLLSENITTYGRLVGEPKLLEAGFALTAMRLTESTPTVYWYNYIVNSNLQLTAALTGLTLLAATNSALITQRSSDSAIIPRYRRDMALSATKNVLTGTFVGANNALIALYVTTVFKIFDVRNGLTYTAAGFGVNQTSTLVGDQLCWARGNRIFIANAIFNE